MAFVGKRVSKPSPGGANFGWMHAVRGAQAFPQTGTDILFRVNGGKVRILALIGTVVGAALVGDPVAKLSSKSLVNGAAVGTAVDIAATATLAALEAGGLVLVKGDGTAIVKSNAGAALSNPLPFIVPQGEIYLTTGASVPGTMKWDVMYEPMDEGATIVASPVMAAI